MRHVGIGLIVSILLLAPARSARAQVGPSGPACHLWGDRLAASAMALQRGIPSALEIEVALQNKTSGSLRVHPMRFVFIPGQGPALTPLTLDQARQAARSPGQQVSSLLFGGIFGLAAETAIQQRLVSEVESRYLTARDVPAGTVVKGSLYFASVQAVSQFSLRLDSIMTESGENLGPVQLTNCILPPRAGPPAAEGQASSAPSPAPAVRTVAVSARAATGPLTVAVSQIEFSPEVTVVTVTIANSAAAEADLFNAIGNATLTDDAGKMYPLRFSRTDLAARVPPRGQVEGRLSFEPLPQPPAVNMATLTMAGIRVGDEVIEIKIQIRL